MPAPVLRGSTAPAADRLMQLRDQLHGNHGTDLDLVRQFVNRYVTLHPDLALNRSASTVEELAGTVRSELGLGPVVPPQVAAALSDQVRDLVLGRALASEDGTRAAVHSGTGQVIMHSGQFGYDRDDIHIDGAGIDFLFRRTYKSLGFHNGPLGVNWDHSYNLRLRSIQDGQQLVVLSGGFRESTYVRHACYGQGPDLDYWVPPPGEHSVVCAADRLALVGLAVPDSCPGCRYVVRGTGGVLHFYEDDPGFPERYRVCRIQDPSGNYLHFRYRSAGGAAGEQLWTVEINDPARLVTFTSYDDSGRLLEVIDYAGRSWRFQFDDFGDLVTATAPGGDRYTKGLTETYCYSTAVAPGDRQHQLLTVYDSADRLVLENDYGSDPGTLAYGRVERQREGAGLRYFQYEDVTAEADCPPGQPEAEEDIASHQTVLIHRNGHPVHYLYNPFGNLIAQEEDVWDGGARRRLTARYRFNRDGSLTASLSPEGRLSRYLYARDVYLHAAGQPAEEELHQREDLDWRTRLGFGNRLAAVHGARLVSDPGLTDLSAVPTLYTAGVEADDVIVKFSYDREFQNLTGISHPAHTRSPFPDAAADDAQANPGFAATRTVLDYDAAGRISRVHYPGTTRDGLPELPPTEDRFAGYDDHGRLLEHEDHGGTRRLFSYFPTVPGDRPDGRSAAIAGYLREQVVDPRDRDHPDGLHLVTSRQVNAVGATIALTTPKGQVIDVDVDAINRVTRITRSLSPAVSYSTRYDYCRNRLVERIERDLKDDTGAPLWGGCEIRLLRYDERDNVVADERQSSDGSVRLITTHTFDDGDLRVRMRLPRGNATRICYDERRLAQRICRGSGTEATAVLGYRYDGDGLLVEYRDGRALRTLFDYDGLGRHIATRHCDEDDHPVQLVRQDFDKAGNLTIERVFDQVGGQLRLLHHVQHSYDERDQRIETRVRLFRSPLPYTRDGFAAQQDAVPLAEAARTLFHYDQGGRLTLVEQCGRRLDAAGRPSTEQTTLVSRYEYNAVGWLTAAVDPLGHRVETSYDPHGLVTRVDVREKVPVGASAGGEEVFTTSQDYDALDRLICVRDGMGNTVRFRYDSRGAVVSRQDPRGGVVSFQYDAFGRLVAQCVRLSAGDGGTVGHGRERDAVTRYEYDGNGNLVCVKDANGSATEYGYDALDRRLTVRYPDGGTLTFGYDANDNVTEVGDPNGVTRWTSFNALDLPLRTEVDTSGLRPGLLVEAGTFQEYEYDGMGRLARARNDWSDIEWQRDSLGRPYQEQLRLPGAPDRYTIERGYDDFGFLGQLTYPSGRRLIRWPDELNRVLAVEDAAHGRDHPGGPLVPERPAVIRNTYRGLRIGAKLYGNGASTSYGYDAAGRITEISHAGAHAEQLMTLQFLYDASGNLHREYEYTAGRGSRGEAYEYDVRDQLTAVHEVEPPGQPLDLTGLGPPPDAAGSAWSRQEVMERLIGGAAGGRCLVTYEYDLVGNRSQEQRPPDSAVAYLVNGSDQLISRGAETFGYDLNGNLVERRDGNDVRIWIYDQNDQLVRAIGNGTDLVSYRHDALGRRVSREAGAAQACYVHDQENEIEAYSRTGTEPSRTLAAQLVNEDRTDSRIQLAVGGAEFWFLKDLLASTRMLTDRQGYPAHQYRYSRFGQWALPGPIPESPTRYLFVGRSVEPMLGSYDLRRREYVPELGRFMQRDPAGQEPSAPPPGIPRRPERPGPAANAATPDTTGGSLYSYALNNPARFIDPLGRQESENQRRGLPTEYIPGQWGLEVQQTSTPTPGNTENVFREALVIGMQTANLGFTGTDDARKRGCCSYPERPLHYRLPPQQWYGLFPRIYFGGPEPSEVIGSIFKEGANSQLDCLGMMLAVQYRAMLQVLGRKRFDRAFGERGSHSIYLHSQMYLSDSGLIRKIPIQASRDLRRGDWVYFQNFPEYSILNPRGYWAGLHALYVGNGRFTGFGLARPMTAEDIHQTLIDQYAKTYRRATGTDISLYEYLVKERLASSGPSNFGMRRWVFRLAMEKITRLGE